MLNKLGRHRISKSPELQCGPWWTVDFSFREKYLDDVIIIIKRRLDKCVSR